MERRAVIVRGTVQGVGFRPFVYGLAQRHSLVGFVRNESGAVKIEVEGDDRRVKQFLDELRHQPPPLANIVDLHSRRVPVVFSEFEFRIERSSADAADDASGVFISADVATCTDCLAELYDPGNRRYKYPFINCTNCGPRLTIIQAAPYDRPRTTMASFAMCAACRREYEEPSDRRFHAQPVCCPACGPQLELCNPQGERIATGDPLADFAEQLKRGRIGALKGLGGYHLACITADAGAVAELRRRKQRDEKPMAVMVRDVTAAARLCEVTEDERELLESPRRPIVLLRKRATAAKAVCEEVAPGNPHLGVMLPYTPLHHLLMDKLDDMALVMTSGNRSDEPIAYLDDDAVRRLVDIADVVLRHNRPIHVRCDDSVTRHLDGGELLVRRSRGFAPQAVALPIGCERPMLAVGGQLKGVFALGSGRFATVSHHMGDLDHFEAYLQFERDIQLYQDLFGISPELLVHDLHPDYASTRYAQARAARENVSLMAVQHHHAHMASCMAENGLEGPVIGVTFDGTGFGRDESSGDLAVWGGEFLVGDYCDFRRAARLRYVAMPGGEKAIDEPWRMAAAHLADAGCDLAALGKRVHAEKLRALERMLDRRINAPLTSSAGRLFDAVAAIAGVRDYVSYEGQAAVELEWLATGIEADGDYPFELTFPIEESLPVVVDTRPLIRAVAADAAGGVGARAIARRFHSTLARIVCDTCRAIAGPSGLERVVLSGGVFLNALLTVEVSRALRRAGFEVFRHKLVPPNDGGLSFGQLAIAAARTQRGKTSNSMDRATSDECVAAP